MAKDNQPDITALTVQLLSAFVSNNSVPSESLADLIRSTRAALTDEMRAPANELPAPTFTPAVSVRKSLSSPDHILSLIDGNPYKTLKRHLARHGLTPQQYRERYSLPASYPMVAQSYSAERRAVAEKLGLGRRTAAVTPSVEPAEAIAPAPVDAPAKPVARVKRQTKARAAPDRQGSNDVEPASAKEAKPAKAPRRPARAKAAPAASVTADSAQDVAEVATPAKSARRKRLSIAEVKQELPAAEKPAKARQPKAARGSKPASDQKNAKPKGEANESDVPG